MMLVTSVESRPFHELVYLNASPRGRAETARLPFLRGRVSELPEGCDALVVASDLQGMASPGWGEAAALLGVSVARAIEELDLGRVAAFLAGDLYSVPEANKRGGFGDVASVFTAFEEFCVRVIGIAGNHDDVARVSVSSRVQVLDGDVVSFGELRIGGVGYVAGNGEKKGRRDESDQLARLEKILGADVALLHEGPSIEEGDRGSPSIRDALIAAPIPLVIHGHRPRLAPLARLSDRVQVLNIHERVIVLTAST